MDMLPRQHRGTNASSFQTCTECHEARVPRRHKRGKLSECSKTLKGMRIIVQSAGIYVSVSYTSSLQLAKCNFDHAH